MSSAPNDQMTPDEVRAYGERLGVRANWGRWGPDDQRGTLNLVTTDNVARATVAARTGTVVSLGQPLDVAAPPYYPQGLDAAVRHEMLTAWGSNAGGHVLAASDQLHVQCHGLDNTHMDALCHIGYSGIGWNGRPFRSMVDMSGAAMCDMLGTGPVVTRGVLVDVPRLRGIDHLPGGEPVTEADLRAAAPDLRPGDALVVRTGRARAVAGTANAAAAEGRSATHKYGPIAGLHHSAMKGRRRARLRAAGHRRLGRHLPGRRPAPAAHPRAQPGPPRGAPVAQPGARGAGRRPSRAWRRRLHAHRCAIAAAPRNRQPDRPRRGALSALDDRPTVNQRYEP